jgi:hypothetical protein
MVLVDLCQSFAQPTQGFDLKSFIQPIMFPIAQCCTNLNVKLTTSDWPLLSPFSCNSFHMFSFKLPFLLSSFKCLAWHNWLGFFFFGPFYGHFLCYESMGSFIIGFILGKLFSCSQFVNTFLVVKFTGFYGSCIFLFFSLK